VPYDFDELLDLFINYKLEKQQYVNVRKSTKGDLERIYTQVNVSVAKKKKK
jgi:hypothetical protein